LEHNIVTEIFSTQKLKRERKNSITNDHIMIGEFVFNPFKVINHLKILILVGIAIIIVVDMK